MTVVEGTSGPDTLVGGSSSQCLVGLGGADNITAGSAGDVVFGGEDGDHLLGGSADDVILGGGAADEITAGSGADDVDAGGGDDHVWAESGNDLVLGKDGADVIDCGSDNDEARGGEGDDVLAGGTGNDVLAGNRGNDTISGESGSDRVRGGPGLDTLTGGSGNDVFVIGAECEVTTGETVTGNSGFDRVESPFTRQELEGMGMSFTSIEEFVQIAALPDECVEVTKPWGADPIAPSPSEIVMGTAPLAGGRTLAATGSTVYEISASGAFTQLAAGDAVIMNEGGNSFGVLVSDQELEVYDGTGILRSVLIRGNPWTYYKLLPGADFVFAPISEQAGLHESVTNQSELYDLDGVLIGQFSTPGMLLSRMSASGVIVSNGSELRKIETSTAISWTANVDVLDFAVSQVTPDRLIATQRFTPGVVLHGTEDQGFATTVLGDTVWDISMSPSGEFSAATTHAGGGVPPSLHIFRDANLVASVQLPALFAVSLDISDLGEVAIGAHTSDLHARVFVYHWQGNMLFDDAGDIERNAHRPAVRFMTTDRLVALATTGASAYDINRSP